MQAVTFSSDYAESQMRRLHGLPSLSDPYLVRKEEMNRLAEYLGDVGATRGKKVVVISGMIGSGKTQLVAGFARDQWQR